MILSAIILVVGLADDDGALVLIGGLGVAFSLIEQNGGGYFRYGTTRRGVDLYKTGSLSFGVTPVAPMGTLTAFNANRPSPYIQMTFKF